MGTCMFYVFGDVCWRCFEPTLETVSQIEQSIFDEWEATQMEHKNGGIDDTVSAVQKEELGIKLFDEVSLVLAACEFQTQAWCFKHNMSCPISPCGQVLFGNDGLWLEGAGSTCCPWSRMNMIDAMWLDRATVPFLVWAYSTRCYEPDGGAHECVPGFSRSGFVFIKRPFDVCFRGA